MKLSPELFARVTGHGAPLVGEKVSDRRADPRLEYHRRGVLLRERSASEAPAVAMVRDISVGGIGLHCVDELSIGETFVVKLPREASEGISECQVTRCAPGMGGTIYDIGATFAEIVEVEQ